MLSECSLNVSIYLEKSNFSIKFYFRKTHMYCRLFIIIIFIIFWLAQKLIVQSIKKERTNQLKSKLHKTYKHFFQNLITFWFQKKIAFHLNDLFYWETCLLFIEKFVTIRCLNRYSYSPFSVYSLLSLIN